MINNIPPLLEGAKAVAEPAMAAIVASFIMVRLGITVSNKISEICKLKSKIHYVWFYQLQNMKIRADRGKPCKFARVLQYFFNRNRQIVTRLLLDYSLGLHISINHEDRRTSFPRWLCRSLCPCSDW